MKILLIIAPRGFQDHEYATPKKFLEEAGFETVTASKNGGACVGSGGSMVKDTIALADVIVHNFAGVIFVGGPGAAIYQHDLEAHHIATEALAEHKVIGAICIGPTILAYAGVLHGKNATVWNLDGKMKDILINNGAKFTNATVTVHNKIVTANGPQAAEEFSKSLIKLLKN